VFRPYFASLALVAALVAPVAASAQTVPAPSAAAPAAPAAGQHHRHHRNGRGFGHALSGLNLSDAQKQQIAGVMKSNRTTMQNAKTADPAARKANRLALRKQIDGVLTNTQRAQLQENLSKERHMKRDHGPAPIASPQ
jgi:Spy/CpxP family protein refolding chaperone